MISFNYENDFSLDDEKRSCMAVCYYRFWEQKRREINYIFCDDDYLHKLNVEYLDHDTLTDVISFDYTMGNEISGDCFISVERWG
jgi:ssRNA-specific RNase YbeY (16S rRNA maturation enzyme)